MSDDPALTDVLVESGLVRDPDGSFRGFCHITAKATDGSEWRGQLDPGDVRLMALGFLGAAEASDHDAAVGNLLSIEFGLGLEETHRFIQSLRDHR